MESVYIVNKFSTPITTMAHDGGRDPVTVLTPTFQDPEFYYLKYLAPFTELEHKIPGLKIKYEPLDRKSVV